MCFWLDIPKSSPTLVNLVEDDGFISEEYAQSKAIRVYA